MNMDELNFTDIHAHILPGVDDGARDMTDTLEMAYIAAQSGTKQLVATPHCNIPGLFSNYYGRWYKELFLEVRDAVGREGIPIRILPGTEALVTEDLPSLIRNKKIMPLNQGKYILVEFDFHEDPAFANTMLDQIRETGARPVIAHVERYEFVQDLPQIIYAWRRRGYVIQVNKASFQGKFGQAESETAHSLLAHNLISVIASDAHSPEVRTPSMSRVYKELLTQYPKKEKILDVLFRYNPERICANKSILKIEPVPYIS